jgi:LPS export ABC transporter protein LptC
MRKMRLVLLSVAVVIIAVVLGLAVGKKKVSIVIRDASEPDAKSGLSIALSDFTYSSSGDDNQKEFDLRAARARHFRAENRIELEDLTASFYKDDRTYRLRGKRGVFYTDTRDILVSGSVEAVMSDNTTIWTDSIAYDHAGRVVSTADPIRIQRGAFTMEGQGMVVDIETEQMTILNKVRATGDL